MRIKLKSGKQKEIIFLAKGEDSWIKLAKLLKINPIYLAHELAIEKRLLSEEIYNRLCSFIGRRFDEYVIARLDDNWGRSKGGQASPKNQKHFSYPKRSKKLAETFGIILGDGHISEYSRGKKVRVFCVRIAGNSFSDASYIKKYIPALFKEVFNENGSIIQCKSSNCAYFTIYGKEMITFLKKKGLKPGNKVKNNVGIPDWIKRDKNFLKGCIRGLIDTDGSVHKISRINNGLRLDFTNRSRRLLSDTRDALISLGFSPSKIINDSHFFLSRQAEVDRYTKEIGFGNSKNLKRMKIFSP